LTRTFLVLVTVGLGHGVYRKLYTVIGGQRAEKFENHWFKVTADATDKSNYCICSTVGLTERNFCDGIEMKFTSPMGGILQASVSETAARSVTPCFTLVSDCKHRWRNREGAAWA